MKARLLDRVDLFIDALTLGQFGLTEEEIEQQIEDVEKCFLWPTFDDFRRRPYDWRID